MFRCPDDFSPDFVPVDAAVQLFVHQADNCDVVASYKIQPMADLRARLRVVSRSNDPLHGVVEDDVGDLIA